MLKFHEDNCVISDIHSLIAVAQYFPKHPKKLIPGLTLGQDLVDEREEILYTRGSILDHDKITRIIKRQLQSQQHQFTYHIANNSDLVDGFRNSINADVKKLLDSKLRYKVFQGFFKNVAVDAQECITSVLQNSNVLLSLSDMRLDACLASHEVPPVLYNHAINVGLFALGLARSEQLAAVLMLEEIDEKLLLTAALVHNIGAACDALNIQKADPEDQQTKYIEHIRRGLFRLMQLSLQPDVIRVLERFADYLEGEQDMLRKSDEISTYVNLLVVADKFCRRVFGVLEPREKISTVVDQLNVSAFEGILRADIVKSLTMGLNLKEIFDFYLEIETLMSLCTIAPKNSYPYPMTGFRSPSLFVCRSGENSCEHYEASVKAVSLVRDFSGLKAGKYSRCKLTTEKLHQFYDERYDV